MREQVPATWHWSEAVQATGLLPVQTPLWQVSVGVQALPSLQALPLAFTGFEHVPVVGEQVPATWHWSEAVQATGLLPAQTPLWQVAVWVQALPSMEVVGGGFAGFGRRPVAGKKGAAGGERWGGVETSGVAPREPAAQRAG